MRLPVSPALLGDLECFIKFGLISVYWEIYGGFKYEDDYFQFVELDKSGIEVHIVIFQMASTSAYDKNEIQVYIIAEKGETIRIGNIITIPMNDHTYYPICVG